MTWEDVREAARTARGISFDGCHKIYVLMDDEQVAKQRGWGYGEGNTYLITAEELDGDTDVMVEILSGMYDESCELRFIQAVRTVEGVPNDGYEWLIEQTEDPDDEEEDQ